MKNAGKEVLHGTGTNRNEVEFAGSCIKVQKLVVELEHYSGGFLTYTVCLQREVIRKRRITDGIAFLIESLGITGVVYWIWKYSCNASFCWTLNMPHFKQMNLKRDAQKLEPPTIFE